ncbi:DHS-like NAD/FAD-binding domain-containing protein [Kockovaella imperatae]|uniref:DHS-like NAD/FAD-binding domain-containing protein n=1 Tax=Kockovaella imperatae TaxID=4999 RepID=A0A1Y1USG0_9TREE|nr:DHS-like NAD/FAD-binding domain-containing protein [Kockovaella imperatae]ORX40464.1 DHS-like NAD/FAD-binding domain-containing protein [Kockovaella imperatae]
MVRISIPTLPPLPPLPPSALTLLPAREAASHLGEFLDKGKGKTVILTGAGVSVESGIRAYRGEDGTYSNPNYKPIMYQELIQDSPTGRMFRKRYWARSFLGYPPVRDAQPNPTHIYIAALQVLGLAPRLITQNVDNLHPKALNLVTSHLPSSSLSNSQILELHGTLAKVHCLEHSHTQPRDDFQAQLGHLNPLWQAKAEESERTGDRPRTNPDGDVELPGADFRDFTVPGCKICEAQGKGKDQGIVKPNVVFFGETLPTHVKDTSIQMLESASQLLVIGTSLATYSAFRLVKQAHEQSLPILMISQGPSRAERGIKGFGEQKMDRQAGPVLRAYLNELLKTNSGPEVEAVKRVLDQGVVKRPPEVEGPRAEG